MSSPPDWIRFEKSVRQMQRDRRECQGPTLHRLHKSHTHTLVFSDRGVSGIKMTTGAAPLKGPLVLLMDLQSRGMIHLSEEEASPLGDGAGQLEGRRRH